MFNDPLPFYLAAGTAALFIALGKGGLGGMTGVLATPIMSLVIPVNEALGLILPMLLVADVFAAYVHWRRWEPRLLRLMLPAAVIGVALGTAAATSVPPLVLRRLLGAIAVVFVVYKLREKRLLSHWGHGQPRPWHAWLAGGVSAFGSAMAHSGGPPVMIYLIQQELAPGVFAATLAAFFALVNVMKVPSYLLAGVLDATQFVRILIVLPLLPLGVWLGKLFATKVKQEPYERLMLVLLVMAGGFLLFD